MSNSFRIAYGLFTATALLALGACRHDATAPALKDVAGEYVLESVSGRGPAEGTFTLTLGREAERRVRYVTSSRTIETVAAGRYELDASGISFWLTESSGPPSHVWQVRGERDGMRFSIRHPDAADGPDIVETYRRR